MNTFFKHLKNYPEIVPVVGCVGAGVLLSAGYITNLLVNHNDIYVNHRTPILQRFDKECPRIITKDTTDSIDKLPFVSVLTIKSPFDK